MATKTAPKKKTAPAKKPVPKNAQAAKAAAKPAEKAIAPEAPPVGETPQKDTATDECPKGGAHEWTDDGKGRFCSRCLEPAAVEPKSASKAASKKKGSAAKDVVPDTEAAPKKKGKAAEQTGFAPQSQLDLEETEKLEATRAKKAAAEASPTKTKAKKPNEQKLSALDAAAKVLSGHGQPMATKEMIDAMAAKGYWTSPGGKTPHSTLYSAILREIGTKGDESRFQKVERGRFAIAEKEGA